MKRKKQDERKTVVRCAVYTRVSTSEQAEGDYSSLDAQRETGESCVASQKHAGWTCLENRYDDGGFTGANVDRPAFQQLLADIEAGKVDCIVCYKLDRLTRSLADFARTLELLESHNVALVSVTQAFDTSTATGKLMMHILMSFAEFERQLISERTRDKIAATRRKGKWSGGMPVLGYDVIDTKLVVNEDEAEQVREIFELYLEQRSLTKVVRELDRRGWRGKQWTTRKHGNRRGGKAFTKTSLHYLLTNPVFIGQVKHKGDVFDGEHVAIVERNVFQRVQERLSKNGANGGRDVRNKCGALLRGLVRCKACDCAMSHSFSTRGNRRYRYYVCSNAQKRGWKSCPHPSLPAGELERFVVEQIREIGRNPEVVAETLAAVRLATDKRTKRLTRERNATRRKLGVLEAEIAGLATANLPEDVRYERVVEAQGRLREFQRRLAELDSELATLATQADGNELVTALAEFNDVWESLKPSERERLIKLLVESVEYDAETESISLALSQTGAFALTGKQEAAA